MKLPWLPPFQSIRTSFWRRRRWGGRWGRASPGPGTLAKVARHIDRRISLGRGPARKTAGALAGQGLGVRA